MKRPKEAPPRSTKSFLAFLNLQFDKAGNCYRCGEAGRCNCTNEQSIQHLYACLQGSNGLNPTAYRGCVEALKACQEQFEEDAAQGGGNTRRNNEGVANQVQQALAHTQQTP